MRFGVWWELKIKKKYFQDDWCLRLNSRLYHDGELIDRKRIISWKGRVWDLNQGLNPCWTSTLGFGIQQVEAFKHQIWTF